MSVLIRGMEMPNNCLECVFYRKTDPDYDYCCISSAVPKGYVPDDCPLTTIRPHGRLIDADASIDVAEGHVSPCQTTIAAFLLNHIEGPAPRVVIPAEEGE